MSTQNLRLTGGRSFVELHWKVKQSKCLEFLHHRCWLRGSCLELTAKIEVLKVYLDLLSCQPLPLSELSHVVTM